MADDHTQRQYRTNEYQRTPGREPANDPLAELARLIGQTDPFAEFGAKQPQQPQRAQQPQHDTRQNWAPLPQATPQAMPGYEQGGASAHDPYPAQAYEQAAPAGYENDQYYANDGYAEDQVDYDDVPPRRPRRLGVIAVAAVVGLAVVGSAAAFGYRALFGTSGSSPPPVIKAETTPTKVVPPSKTDSQSNKLIYDRVGDRGANEKIVSREEQPVDISKTAQPTAFPATMSGGQPPATSVSNSGAPSLDQPKKVHTIVIKPDQQQATAEPAAPTGATNRPAPAPQAAPAPTPAPRAAPPQRLASAPPVATADAEEAAPVARAPARQTPAPSRNAPLSLSPNAAAAPAPPPEPVRTASAPPARSAAPATSGTGQYAVQISSQRSEAEAQAAFRALQAKYPAQLGNRQPLIRRADLGSKGIYYRALVGPFANGSDATALCQSLKSAGGSCLIQKN
jgi:hypothetical protein